jgi:hypothetical protein
VALVGAAVIVANPLVMPPDDIQVSAAEFAASGGQIDVLDRDFLASIGAAQEGWQEPVKVLESLLSGLVDKPGTDVSPLSDTFARFLETRDPTQLADAVLPRAVEAQQGADVLSDVATNSVIAAIPSGSGPLDSVFTNGGAENVVKALANIGTGFGDSGSTFLKQVGLAPQVVSELAQRVEEGTLTPIEAIRRLILQPFIGHPALTGNPSIDALFTTGVFQPLITALIASLPAPLGQDGGLLDTVETGLTRLGDGGSGTPAPPADVLTKQAPQQAAVVVDNGQSAAKSSETSSTAGELGNTPPADVPDSAPTSSSGGSGSTGTSNQPGGFPKRVSDTVNGFTGTVRTTVTGGGGQTGQSSQSGSAGDAPGSNSPTSSNSSTGGAGAHGGNAASGGAGSAPGSNNG